jgi:hypothetical protein
MGWFGFRPRSRPEDIPKKLNSEALEKTLHEARFLHSHEVDVRPLKTGEIPLPRRADKD